MCVQDMVIDITYPFNRGGEGKGQGMAHIRLLAQGPQHVNPALGW